MHVFYFLTPIQHFELLKEVVVNWRVPIGISLRRFSPSGFEAGYEACRWDENLASKYVEGGYSEIYLTTNKSSPLHKEDWEFTDRELHDLIIIEGGRIWGNELEISYLRVFAKQSNCVPFYRKIRRRLRENLKQGLYAGQHYYKNTFYSLAAAEMRMLGKRGGNEYAPG